MITKAKQKVYIYINHMFGFLLFYLYLLITLCIICAKLCFFYRTDRKDTSQKINDDLESDKNHDDRMQ